MTDDNDEDDPYGLALDALQAAGLTPHPICGYRAGELEGREGVGILEYRQPLTPDERERIDAVMGALPYLLDEVVLDSTTSTMRRVEDGRVLGGWITRSSDGRLDFPSP